MMRRHVITQGERAVSADPETVIFTLLGSCVACCLRDPLAQVGGMNHILLAGGAASGRAGAKGQGPGQAALCGINAMELLVNDLLKRGARRDRLEAKVFGGARMIAGLSDIGAENSAVVLQFLEGEGIKVLSQSLGGESARQLLFWPTTGRVRQRVNVAAPAAPVAPPVMPVAACGNGVEVF